METDILCPFQLESIAARGRLLRLGPAVDTILKQHVYPWVVEHLLAEVIVLGGILSSYLKFDGVITLQLKGKGPIKFIVVDVTTQGAIRGYAQFDVDALERLGCGKDPTTKGVLPSVSALVGAGYLMITIDQGEYAELYQGIVDLEGQTVADCVHHYFRQSEQLKAAIKIAAHWDKQNGWQAGGLMLQQLPKEGGTQQPKNGEEADHDTQEDEWVHLLTLMGTLKETELLDKQLPLNTILYRLFHQEGVRVYNTTSFQAQCRCKRERVFDILKTFPAEELQSLKINNKIEAHCEFCNALYSFEEAELTGEQSV